jgi:hypothetical protein
MAFLIFYRTTSAELQAWEEAERIFREGGRILTLAKGRTGKRCKRLKAEWPGQDKLWKRSEGSPS